MSFRDPERYERPVGLGVEPREELRRWIGRVFTLALVGLIVWIAWARVINPPG
jgi:hypothetical protein